MLLALFVVDNYRRGVERLRTCSRCERYRICFDQGSRVETGKKTLLSSWGERDTRLSEQTERLSRKKATEVSHVGQRQPVFDNVLHESRPFHLPR